MNPTNLIEDLRLLSPPRYEGWFLLAVVLIAAPILWLLVRHFRRHTAPLSSRSDPEPWTAALAELEHLTALLTTERCREYAMASTSILRRYLETRYHLHAPTLATEEFLVVARDSAAVPLEHRSSLGRFLELCDLLKFGRYTATRGELEALHAAAVGFVLASRPARPAGKVPEAAG